MLFLADESCDFVIVRALRAAGYDVKAVSDIAPGVPMRKSLILQSGNHGHS